jgi:hypothetical protein
LKVTSKEKGRETRESSKGKVSVMVHYLIYVFPDTAGQQHEGKMSVTDDTFGTKMPQDLLLHPHLAVRLLGLLVRPKGSSR